MSFKCLTRRAPGYLSTQFIRRCDVTNRRTRSSQMLTYLALEQQVAKGLFSTGQLLYGISCLTILNFVNRLIKVFKRRLK